MTRAKITNPDGYRCSPSGARVEVFAFGEIVTGKVADWALADHAGQRMFDPREAVKVEAVPEVKKTRTRRASK